MKQAKSRTWLDRHVRQCSYAPKGRIIYISAPKFLRCFKRWLRSVEALLPVRLRIRQKSARMIRLSIDGYPDELEVYVDPNAIDVAVMWRGECMDYLVSLDMAVPILTRNGITCEQCLKPFNTRRYKSLELFWIEHQFNAFADWLNMKLAAASWLVVCKRSGSSWAKLYKEQPLATADDVAVFHLKRAESLNASAF